MYVCCDNVGWKTCREREHVFVYTNLLHGVVKQTDGNEDVVQGNVEGSFFLFYRPSGSIEIEMSRQAESF